MKIIQNCRTSSSSKAQIGQFNFEEPGLELFMNVIIYVIMHSSLLNSLHLLMSSNGNGKLLTFELATTVLSSAIHHSVAIVYSMACALFSLSNFLSLISFSRFIVQLLSHSDSHLGLCK